MVYILFFPTGGPIYVTYAMPTMDQIELDNPDVINGRWRPKNCTARHRIAIIIPYRYVFRNVLFSFGEECSTKARQLSIEIKMLMHVIISFKKTSFRKCLI